MASRSISSSKDISHANSLLTASAGNGLFATKDILPGEVIIRIDQPLLAVPDSPRLRDTCAHCFQGGLWKEDDGTDVTLKACTGCKIVRYCGKACQSQSWKHHHKHECKIYSSLYPNVLPNTVRMVVQLLLLRKANALPDSDWEAFMKLQHHLDDFKKSTDIQNTWESLQLMGKAAKEYSKTSESIDLIQSMTGRLLINSLTLVAPTYEPLGFCLDPLPALMNHSCQPNAVVSFDGSRLSVRALSAISKGKEIQISYIDITNPVPMRQMELQTRYFFNCICPECTNGTTLGQPDNPPPLAAALPSPKLQELEKKGFELRLDAKQAVNDMAALAILDKGLALYRPYKSKWPLHRQPYAHLRQASILTALNAQQWVKAVTQSLVIYFHIDPILFEQPFHPLRVVHKWVLIKLFLHVSALWEMDEKSVQKFAEKYQLNFVVVMWGLLQEVVGNVGRSHGEDSKFGAMVKRKLDEFKADLRGMEGSFGREELEEEWAKLRKVADGGI